MNGAVCIYGTLPSPIFPHPQLKTNRTTTIRFPVAGLLMTDDLTPEERETLAVLNELGLLLADAFGVTVEYVVVGDRRFQIAEPEPTISDNIKQVWSW